MDGLETLVAIREAWPGLPVIMFSTLTERAATATLDALALGASDYVTKPSGTGGLAASLRRVREDLLPKIHALCPSRPAAPMAARPASAVAVAPRGIPTRTRPVATEVGIVAIGVSTGGPSALSVLLQELPASLATPVVITQHMPPMFTRLLAERLDARCALRVVEGAEGHGLQAGTVYVAPGDRHMTLRRTGGAVRIHLTQDPPENSCRPAVDVMLRSVVAQYGAGTLGVILTGMGRDGLRGCERIRAAGGSVLAQDEASSVIWGMPGLVARAGLADAVVPLSEMAAEIARRVAGAPGEAERTA
jgi:two-component system chemotaxis response regulator CheB